jgi:hypothetical protein
VTPPELVVLGNLLVDDVVFPDGRTRMGQPGGAVLYFALGASLSGLHTGIVSLLGSDYPAWALDALAGRGIDLAGIHDLGRPGGRAWLLYEGRRRQIVHWMDRPTHTDVSPAAEHIPKAWAAARAFHIAPMPFEVQESLAAGLSRRPGAFVSLDPWLVLRPDTLEPWRRVLDRVDALFLSEDEMEIGREDPVGAPSPRGDRTRSSGAPWTRPPPGGASGTGRERAWSRPRSWRLSPCGGPSWRSRRRSSPTACRIPTVCGSRLRWKRPSARTARAPRPSVSSGVRSASGWPPRTSSGWRGLPTW